MTNMKKLILLFSAAIISVSLYAVVATPQPIQITQSDGSVLTVKLQGDEHFSYRTTTDNYFVAKDHNGNYCYVNYQTDGSYQMTSVIAHNPDLRTKDETVFVQTLSKQLPCEQSVAQRRRVAQQAHLSSTFPRTGSPRSIVILVNYTDVKFKNTLKDFDRMCNESGYHDNFCQGSCRDFYITQSDSLFQPDFDVFGPYDLEHNQEWYGGNSGNNNSQRAADMILEGCAKAMAAGVDFSNYDYDNDGFVDNVFVFYAGHGEADTGQESAVWPHRSVITSSTDYNGKRLRDYACTSELRGGGGMATIGTFCHEFGHVIGLPDYYDTQNSANETIGAWDIMCSGSYNGPDKYSGATPPSYSAHSRWWLGWRKDVEQLTNKGLYTLAPLETTNAKSYIIAEGTHSMSPITASEFFMLENRQRVGWDDNATALPGVGLLVWHINYNAGLWTSNVPNSGGELNYGILLPSGRDRTAGSREDTYPGANNRTEFNPILKDGTNLYQPVFSISQIGDDITFVYKSESDNPISVIPAELDMFKSAYDTQRKIFKYIDVKKILLHSDSINPSVPVEITASNTSILFAADSGKWETSLKIKPNIDSTLNQYVFIGFRPSKMYCEDEPYNGMITIKQGNNQHVMSVVGIAPREVLVTTPESQPATNVTPYTAQVNWNTVEDATKYYLTLYKISDGESSFIQSFENFDDPANVSLDGWETNFNRTTTVYKSEGKKSLHFKNTDEYMITEKYVQPITSISFFHQSFTVTSLNEVGYFILEANNGEKWDTIQSDITVYSAEKATKSFDFAFEKGYIQFRLTYVAYPKSDGTAVDEFIAECSTHVGYLYSGNDLVLDATEEPQMSYMFGNLSPQQEYHFYVQASDEGQGGCQTTVTAPSREIIFTTLQGSEDVKDLTYSLDSIGYDKYERVIYIPNVEGDGLLQFYDAFGHLIASVSVAEGQNRVPFPNANFVKGQWYLIQYAPNNKLSRKNRRVKILY